MRCCFWFLFAIPFYSITIAQPSCPRKHINFDNDWKFHFGNASDPKKDFNFGIAAIFSKSGKSEGTAISQKFNDSNWITVQLPHDWAVELPFANSPSFDVMAHGYKPVGGLFPETSIGWYRKHFWISKTDSGRRFQLQFDGIFRDAMIWVNGFYLGNNKSGYSGVEYDITDYLNYDKENTVVVRADASQYEGWFYEGAGIYRHVWLNTCDNLHIPENGIYIHTDVRDKLTTVHIETTVHNENAWTGKCTVSTYVTTREGKIIGRSAEQPLSLHGNEKQTAKQVIEIMSPVLWSTGNPYLYRVVSLVKTGGKKVDSIKMRFGIRTIAITAQGLFVNGEYTKVHGVNCHQDAAGVGSALPDYLQYYRIRLLKQMGVNAYRTSHNAPSPELLDACDSLGILVLDENRLLNSSPEYMGQFEKLILRDRSRACVFLWSIGNEEGYIQYNHVGKSIAQTFITRQKELDPTRTCTYAADMGNIFHGINEVIPVRGFNYRQFDAAAYHRDHPLQPVIGTEMGSTVTTRGIYIRDTVHAYVPDEDITAPWWASKAEDWWKLAADNAWWMGGFVWTGFDYRGEPTPYQWPNISSHFGIMDACGFPKNIYYYYQSWWTDNDVLHISPHWNWKGKEGQPIDVWVNTNADDVELFLNGKSQGKKDMPRNSHLQWSIPYEPGVIEAIAYKKGRKLSAKTETTGDPHELVISPSKTTMMADGKDVAVINISTVDRRGREVPDAGNLVHFSVTGDAKIIGTGNGDPSSHEQDRFADTTAQRYLFNGKCQVIVQAGGNRSEIKLFAKADSLLTASTTILSIQPGMPHPVIPDKNNFPASGKMNRKPVDKMLGADISFLPQLEDRGMKFFDKDTEKDAIEILKDHGFNYIRLRIFADPAADSGYSPKKGFCDLAHTAQMAKRIKAAGMKFLLDFHYSDYWADPQHEYKPAAWKNENFTQLRQSVYDYTKKVMEQLKGQGTLPDMVQVGNEINHGMIWPEGEINNLDSLAQLIVAGISGAMAVAPSTTIMLHIALGGQNDEARFFLDNMTERGVPFDVIGLSYYPKWHGTTGDLRYNLADLSSHYNKDVIVVEYSQRKEEVNDIAFTVPGGRGKGTCIWEPLSTWEGVFDRKGKSNDLMLIYDDISKKYLGAK